MTSRALGYFETYCRGIYELFSGDGLVITLARIRGPLDETKLRMGLYNLQLESPLLQAHGCTGPDKDVFSTEGYQGLTTQERIAKVPLSTINEDEEKPWSAVVEHGFNQPVESHTQYLWRAVFIRAAELHTFVLYTRHEISDASSTTNMIFSLIRELDGDCTPKKGEETLLPPPIDLLLENKETPPETPSERVPFTTWKFEDFAPTSQRHSMLIYQVIEKSTTDQLLKRARRHGTTINSLLSAALILSKTAHVEKTDPQSKNVKLNTAISLRKYPREDVSPFTFGTYVTVVEALLPLLGEHDIWSLAKHCGEQLKAGIGRMDKANFFPDSFSKKDLYEGLKAEERTIASEHAFTCPVISNLGRLKPVVESTKFEIEFMAFNSKQIMGDYSVNLSVLTLNGRIFCCFNSPAPLLSRDTMVALSKTFVALLSKTAEESDDD